MEKKINIMKVQFKTWCKLDKKLIPWEKVKMDPYSYLFQEKNIIVPMQAAWDKDDFYRFKDGEIVHNFDICTTNNIDLFKIIFERGCFYVHNITGYNLTLLNETNIKQFIYLGNVYENKKRKNK